MPFVNDKKTHDTSLHFGKLIGYGTFQLNQSFTRSLLLQEQIAIQKWKGFTLVCEVVMLANQFTTAVLEARQAYELLKSNC